MAVGNVYRRGELPVLVELRISQAASALLIGWGVGEVYSSGRGFVPGSRGGRIANLFSPNGLALHGGAEFDVA